MRHWNMLLQGSCLYRKRLRQVCVLRLDKEDQELLLILISFYNLSNSKQRYGK